MPQDRTLHPASPHRQGLILHRLLIADRQRRAALRRQADLPLKPEAEATRADPPVGERAVDNQAQEHRRADRLQTDCEEFIPRV